MKFRRELLLMILVNTVAAGCASDPVVGSFTVDTLATGTVVVHNSDDGMWSDGEAWILNADLRIGTLEGDGPDLFGRITDFAIDETGRIHVFDGQAQELRVFDSDGEFVRTVGRRGEGPGEFSNVSGMEWGPEGNLWIVDPSNARVSLFDSSGALDRIHRIDAIQTWPWSGGFDATGGFYSPGSDPTEGVFRLALVGYDDQMQPADTIQYPEYPGEANFFEHTTGTSRMRAGVPFSGGIIGYLVSHTDYYWFGITDEYRIIQRTLAGDTAKVILKDFEPVSVTGADIDSVFEQMEWFTRQGGSLDRSKVPPHKPAIGNLFVDDAGRVWVFPTRRPRQQQQLLEVFDTEGRFLGRVEIPLNLSQSPRPIAIGDFIYGVSRDELDVSYLVRLRISR